MLTIQTSKDFRWWNYWFGIVFFAPSPQSSPPPSPMLPLSGAMIADRTQQKAVNNPFVLSACSADVPGYINMSESRHPFLFSRFASEIHECGVDFCRNFINSNLFTLLCAFAMQMVSSWITFRLLFGHAEAYQYGSRAERWGQCKKSRIYGIKVVQKC